MPANPADNNTVQVKVGGKAHTDWNYYEVDSDLLTPADAWNVRLGLKNDVFPPQVKVGEPVEVLVGADLVLTGHIGKRHTTTRKGSRDFTMSGRDGAAVLVDCSPPIFVAQQSTLQEIVAKIVRPLGIVNIRIDADAPRTRKKVNVEPCDTAWAALQNAAEANGLFPWFEPDGTLVVGGPKYDTPVVAHLIMRRDGKGNNIESLEVDESFDERYSDVTVLGQTHGTYGEPGKNNLRATVKDPAISWYRPKIVIDHEADNEAVCRSRATKLISDARLHGFTMTITVKGHRNDEGVLWTPGQRIHVLSEPDEIDAVYFLMARRFTGGRDNPTITTLTLKEDGVWTIEAHPHSRKHRRGKNSVPLAIPDLATPVGRQ